jgi:hypothetical protein
MEEIAEEPIALLERVTAPGIGKAALTVRAGAARDHARSPPTAGPHLRYDHPVAAGAAGLAGLPGVTRVATEATFAYWKPPACWKTTSPSARW